MRRVLPIVLSLSLVVSGLGFVPTVKMVPDASAAVAGKLSDASQGEILESLDEGNIIDEVSGNAWKSEANANPISPSIFCANFCRVQRKTLRVWNQRSSAVPGGYEK